MTSFIGQIRELDGKFYSKSADGSLRELSQGDKIFEGESIVGDEGNTEVDSVVVSLIDDSAPFVILGNETQLFDASLVEPTEFSATETVSEPNSIVSIVEKTDEETNLDDIDTAAGEDGGTSSSEAGEAAFDVHDDISVDVTAKLSNNSLDSEYVSQEARKDNEDLSESELARLAGEANNLNSGTGDSDSYTNTDTSANTVVGSSTETDTSGTDDNTDTSDTDSETDTDTTDDNTDNSGTDTETDSGTDDNTDSSGTDDNTDTSDTDSETDTDTTDDNTDNSGTDTKTDSGTDDNTDTSDTDSDTKGSKGKNQGKDDDSNMDIYTDSDDDFILMGSGNDKVNIKADDANGKLIVDGGDGKDKAIFFGNYEEYTVSTNEDGYTIVEETSTGDISELRNIEKVEFSDGNYKDGEFSSSKGKGHRPDDNSDKDDAIHHGKDDNSDDSSKGKNPDSHSGKENTTDHGKDDGENIPFGDFMEEAGKYDLTNHKMDKLELSLEDVLDMSDDNNILEITGDRQDKIELDSNDWKQEGSNDGFKEYTSNEDPTVTLKIDENINVDGF